MASMKEYLPRSSTDTIAMTVTFSGIFLGFLHGIFYVTPSLYPLDDQLIVRVFHYTLMLYLLFTVLADLLLTLVTDPSCKQLTLPQMAQPGWAYCSYCKQYVPPRTHHCLTCQKCFLRRDHHCFFVGRCVGYQNHKYFLLFVFHTFVTSVFALVLSVRLVFFLNGGFSWGVMLASFLPVMAWTMQLTIVSPVVLIFTSVALLFSVMCGAMLIMHLLHLYNGQTYWEAQNGVPQPKGWIRNAQDILGSNWWLIWICPLIPSPLPGDGLHYPPKEAVKRPGPQQRQAPPQTNSQVKRKRV